MTLEFSKASCSLFSELQWNLISFGSDGGILMERFVQAYDEKSNEKITEAGKEVLLENQRVLSVNIC